VVHASNLKAVKRRWTLSDLLKLRSRKPWPGICHRRRRRVPVYDVGYLPEEGIADRFRFTGWVDHEKMPAYLNLADIVVMASEIETQALVYLEAQASGRSCSPATYRPRVR